MIEKMEEELSALTTLFSERFPPGRSGAVSHRMDDMFEELEFALSQMSNIEGTLSFCKLRNDADKCLKQVRDQLGNSSDTEDLNEQQAQALLDSAKELRMQISSRVLSEQKITIESVKEAVEAQSQRTEELIDHASENFPALEGRNDPEQHVMVMTLSQQKTLLEDISGLLDAKDFADRPDASDILGKINTLILKQVRTEDELFSPTLNAFAQRNETLSKDPAISPSIVPILVMQTMTLVQEVNSLSRNWGVLGLQNTATANADTNALIELNHKVKELYETLERWSKSGGDDYDDWYTELDACWKEIPRLTKALTGNQEPSLSEEATPLGASDIQKDIQERFLQAQEEAKKLLAPLRLQVLQMNLDVPQVERSLSSFSTVLSQQDQGRAEILESSSEEWENVQRMNQRVDLGSIRDQALKNAKINSLLKEFNQLAEDSLTNGYTDEYGVTTYMRSPLPEDVAKKRNDLFIRLRAEATLSDGEANTLWRAYLDINKMGEGNDFDVNSLFPESWEELEAFRKTWEKAEQTRLAVEERRKQKEIQRQRNVSDKDHESKRKVGFGEEQLFGAVDYDELGDDAAKIAAEISKNKRAYETRDSKQDDGLRKDAGNSSDDEPEQKDVSQAEQLSDSSNPTVDVTSNDGLLASTSIPSGRTLRKTDSRSTLSSRPPLNVTTTDLNATVSQGLDSDDEFSPDVESFKEAESPRMSPDIEKASSSSVEGPQAEVLSAPLAPTSSQPNSTPPSTGQNGLKTPTESLVVASASNDAPITATSLRPDLIPLPLGDDGLKTPTEDTQEVIPSVAPFPPDPTARPSTTSAESPRQQGSSGDIAPLPQAHESGQDATYPYRYFRFDSGNAIQPLTRAIGTGVAKILGISAVKERFDRKRRRPVADKVLGDAMERLGATAPIAAALRDIVNRDIPALEPDNGPRYTNPGDVKMLEKIDRSVTAAREDYERRLKHSRAATRIRKAGVAEDAPPLPRVKVKFEKRLDQKELIRQQEISGSGKSALTVAGEDQRYVYFFANERPLRNPRELVLYEIKKKKMLVAEPQGSMHTFHSPEYKRSFISAKIKALKGRLGNKSKEREPMAFQEGDRFEAYQQPVAAIYERRNPDEADHLISSHKQKKHDETLLVPAPRQDRALSAEPGDPLSSASHAGGSNVPMDVQQSLGAAVSDASDIERPNIPIDQEKALRDAVTKALSANNSSYVARSIRNAKSRARKGALPSASLPLLAPPSHQLTDKKESAILDSPEKTPGQGSLPPTTDSRAAGPNSNTTLAMETTIAATGSTPSETQSRDAYWEKLKAISLIQGAAEAQLTTDFDKAFGELWHSGNTTTSPDIDVRNKLLSDYLSANGVHKSGKRLPSEFVEIKKTDILNERDTKEVQAKRDHFWNEFLPDRIRETKRNSVTGAGLSEEHVLKQLILMAYRDFREKHNLGNVDAKVSKDLMETYVRENGTAADKGKLTPLEFIRSRERSIVDDHKAKTQTPSLKGKEKGIRRG